MIDDDNYIEVFFQKIFNVFFWIFIIWVGCWLYTKLTEDPVKVDTTPFFKVDPNKSVTDIKSLDYNTGEVTYRSYGPPSRDYSNTYTTTTYTTISTPSAEIKVALSPAEIIQQLDIDYHDLYDYYGEEIK